MHEIAALTTVFKTGELQCFIIASTCEICWKKHWWKTCLFKKKKMNPFGRQHGNLYKWLTWLTFLSDKNSLKKKVKYCIWSQNYVLKDCWHILVDCQHIILKRQQQILMAELKILLLCYTATTSAKMQHTKDIPTLILFKDISIKIIGRNSL